MRAERTCEACGHHFPQQWRSWNAVDVRYERCTRCGHENGYGSDLHRWLRQRKEGSRGREQGRGDTPIF